MLLDAPCGICSRFISSARAGNRCLFAGAGAGAGAAVDCSVADGQRAHGGARFSSQPGNQVLSGDVAAASHEVVRERQHRLGVFLVFIF